MTERKPEHSAASRRQAGIFWLVAFAGLVLLVFLASHSFRRVRPGSNNLADTVHAFVNNPGEFAKNRIEGGVGAVLTDDPAAGHPRIVGVLAGSPADQAGLRSGDLILTINGANTAGQKLAQAVQAIRGFSLGSVAITVLRGNQPNPTNLDFVIRRNSLNSLLQRTNSGH